MVLFLFKCKVAFWSERNYELGYFSSRSFNDV